MLFLIYICINENVILKKIPFASWCWNFIRFHLFFRLSPKWFILFVCEYVIYIAKIDNTTVKKSADWILEDFVSLWILRKSIQTVLENERAFAGSSVWYHTTKSSYKAVCAAPMCTAFRAKLLCIEKVVAQNFEKFTNAFY